MATVPRGILTINYTNKDGSVSTSYRVRIVTKKFNADKRFDDLEEAKAFLALTKTKRGKELYYNKTEKEEKEEEEIADSFINDYSLGFYIDKFIKLYIDTRPNETELQKRNIANIKSFYKTLKNTKIPNRHLTHIEKLEQGVYDMPDKISYKYLKNFDIRIFNFIEVNLYAEERLLDGMKKVSISREITQLSNVYRKLRHLNDSLSMLQNPCLHYDKDLLKEVSSKREFRISEEEKENLFKLLSQKSNIQLYQICMISMLTSLRRSEIVYLTFSKIKENYIQLSEDTKSRKGRRVWIDKRAKDFLDTIKKRKNTDRLFTHTIAGFEGSFNKFLADNKFDLKFHDFRKMAITKKLIEIGAENSVFITEFLGISNLQKFEDTYIDKQAINQNNQASALKSFGHSFAQTTKIYFKMPQIIKKDER